MRRALYVGNDTNTKKRHVDRFDALVYPAHKYIDIIWSLPELDDYSRQHPSYCGRMLRGSPVEEGALKEILKQSKYDSNNFVGRRQSSIIGVLSLNRIQTN